MKAIQLQTLTMSNFRGETLRTTNFRPGQSVTTIEGANGLGKTRHMDAFHWLLFGKDSKDRKDFNIRSYDSQGNVIHRVDTYVEATLIVDGTTIQLKRTLNESWVKPRGQKEEVYRGTITECEWDHTPMRVGDFNKRIESELIEEQLFKLITSNTYFFTLKQDQQRAILLSLVPQISDEEIAKDNQQFSELLSQLSGKSIADYRAMISKQKKRLKGQKDEIEPRIKQTQELKPTAEDWGMLQNLIEQKEKEIDDNYSLIESQENREEARNEQIASIRKAIYNLQQDREQLTRQYRMEAQEQAYKANETRRAIESELKKVHTELSDTNIDLSRLNRRIAELDTQHTELKEKLDKLREEWKVIKNATYNETETCPLCGQKLPQHMIQEEQRKNEVFRSEQLNENVSKGKNTSSIIKEIQEELSRLNGRKQELQQQQQLITQKIEQLYDKLRQHPVVTAQEPDMNSVPEYQQCVQEEAKLKESLEKLQAEPSENREQAIRRHRELNDELRSLHIRMNSRTLIQHMDNEIEDLQNKGRRLAQQISDIEKQEITMQDFAKAKVSMMHSSINRLFKTITWKLYDYTIEGSEYEVCIPLINGTPYASANTAAQINAGIEIANAIASSRGVYAPIFIDRAESVNNVTSVNAQMILLKVTDEKQLTVK